MVQPQTRFVKGKTKTNKSIHNGQSICVFCIFFQIKIMLLIRQPKLERPIYILEELSSIV